MLPPALHRLVETFVHLQGKRAFFILALLVPLVILAVGDRLIRRRD